MGPEPSPDIPQLQSLARLVRYHCLKRVSAEPSAHLTASLSAADLMTGLLFGGSFRFDVDTPDHPHNDRLIFSDEAAAPLLHALWSVATTGGDHHDPELPAGDAWPTRATPTEVLFEQSARGSAEGELEAGYGDTLMPSPTAGEPAGGARRTYVLLRGNTITDSARCEAIQLAARYRVPNLVGIICINRLSRRSRKGVIGRDLAAYALRIAAHGWKTLTIDGHDFLQILAAFRAATTEHEQPVMIIARTLKSDDLSFIDEQWHGRVLDASAWTQVLAALAPASRNVRGIITPPSPPVLRVSRETVLARAET